MPLLVAKLRPEWIVRRPLAVGVLLSAISVASAAALIDPSALDFRMSLDPSEEHLMPRDDPARDVYRDAVRNFGDDDLYVIGMETDDLFAPESLAVLQEIGRMVRRIDGVRSIRSLLETTDYRYDPELDMVEVDNFIDEIPNERAVLEQLRRRAVTHDLYRKAIVSEDGRTAAINVAFRPMTDGEFVAAGIDDRITRLVSPYRTPTRRFFVTGRQHIKARAHRIMVDDLLLLIPLAVLVGAAIAWILAGSLLSGVLPVATSLIATLWAFGALAALGRPLNLITIILGPTLICVGSVYGVHVMSLHRDLVRSGLSSRPAAEACVRYAFAPVSIAGLTTCFGFSALLLAQTPAIQELGFFCVIGVAVVTMLSLTALPTMLGVLQPHRSEVRAGVLNAPLERVLDATAALVRHRPGAILAAWALVTAAALIAIPRIVVDSDYLTFFDARSDVRDDFERAGRLLVGAVPLYVTVDGGAEGAFREPDNLRALQGLQRRIDMIEGVSSTTSVVDFVRTLNRTIEKDDPTAERIPDTRGEVADVMFLIPKTELRPFANSNHSHVNIVVRTGRSGSAAVLELERRLREAIAAERLPPGLHADVTGNAIVVNHGAEGIARNQFSTITAASIAILLLVTRAFRSLRVGALAMIPNLVPVAVFFGILGLGVAPLSLPTSLIGCIALGIAIDDTAHFLVGYRRRREAGMSPHEAAADCIHTLGRPIVTTSLMLMGGFSVLMFSGFATLREFGYLTAITMFVCLCADLLLLPAVLIRARV